jgi:hypothetical protein
MRATVFVLKKEVFWCVRAAREGPERVVEHVRSQHPRVVQFLPVRVSFSCGRVRVCD